MHAEDIVELARVLPRDRFVAEVLNPLLVISDINPDSQPIGFQTVATSPSEHRRPPRGPAIEVIQVTKAKGNPYPDLISIGRTRNCDVVLRHRSVSKLHAHFRREPDGRLRLADNGSQNGTRLNGIPLRGGEPRPVNVGDVLQFGHLTATLTDAAGLFDMLRFRRVPGTEFGR